MVVLIMEAAHLITDFIPAVGLFPQIGGMHDRHKDLLAADRVNLLTHNIFQLRDGAFGQGHERIDARAELADKAGFDQQLVADGFHIRGRIPQSLGE